MSQHTARHDQHGKSEDEDVADMRTRQPEHGQVHRPHQPLGQPADDGGVGPDEPDEDEFELAGDNDLGPADLGPLSPDATDPDAGSGRMRKMGRATER